NPIKIRIASAKARGPKEKYLPVLDFFQKFRRLFITASLIRPEARADSLRPKSGLIRLSKIEKVLLGNTGAKNLCQFPCVTCFAAVYNRPLHIIHLSSL